MAQLSLYENMRSTSDWRNGGTVARSVSGIQITIFKKIVRKKSIFDDIRYFLTVLVQKTSNIKHH